MGSEGVDGVDDVLPRKLLTLLQLQRECIHDGSVVLRLDVEVVSPLEESLQLEALVLGHIQVFDLLGLQPEPLATHQVTHVPDGDVVVRRQVGAQLVGQEVVDLLLTAYLTGEILCGDPHFGIAG